MPKTFFITTAIYYTNSSPHVGHAYELVLADVIARYHRLKRENVFFLTGVDQHGQKVQQSAAKAGVPPAAIRKGHHTKVHRPLEGTECAIRRLGRDDQRPVTRKSFKEFCSGCSMRARSIRTNKPAITQSVRNNS